MFCLEGLVHPKWKFCHYYSPSCRSKPVRPSFISEHKLRYFWWNLRACMIMYRAMYATELWAPERPDTGTVSSLKQSISWTLDTKRGTHNIIIHYLFITHTYFSFQICTNQTCTHNCLYYILCFCYFVHCLFVYYSFIMSCRCHSVALWSFCHYKFLVCVNIPGQ